MNLLDRIAHSNGNPQRAISTLRFINQQQAGAAMSGGDYALVGGFWGVGESGGEPGVKVYLPIMIKGN